MWVWFFFWPRLMQDLSSLTREGTCAPDIEVQSPNHWSPADCSWTYVWCRFWYWISIRVCLFDLSSYPFGHLSVFGQYHIILIIRYEGVLISPLGKYLLLQNRLDWFWFLFIPCEFGINLLSSVKKLFEVLIGSALHLYTILGENWHFLKHDTILP